MRYDKLVQELMYEFPRLRIVSKRQSFLMRFLDVCLRLLTLNKTYTFLTECVTTVGTTIYVPSNWSDLPENYRLSTLRHERVHMRQMRKYGTPLFVLLYLLAPLPIGFAWFRAKFEMEAYAESMRADCETYGDLTLRSRDYREGILEVFTGPNYGWMWPFRTSVERWYDGVAHAILRERTSNADTERPPSS